MDTVILTVTVKHVILFLVLSYVLGFVREMVRFWWKGE
jgi:hypothetical protein